MSSSEGNNFIQFKAILTFIKELEHVFGSKNRALQRYHHLLKKTTIANEKIANKHVAVFKEFCLNNKDAIVNKNESKIAKMIKYSDNVYVTLDKIFSLSDRETKDVIWTHLQVILSLFDSQSNIILREKKDQLPSLLFANEEGGNEDVLSSLMNNNLISNVMNKIENHVNPEDTPEQVLSNIISSGMLQELVGEMSNEFQNGSFDLSQIIGSVMSQLGNEDISNIVSSMNNVN